MDSNLPPCKPITVTIIGLGLIGGTFAYAFRDAKIASKVIGVDSNKEHEQKALELNIATEILPFKEAVQQAGLIVLAIPVNACVEVLPKVLDLITDGQMVVDMGSTKENLIQAVKNHPRRRRYLPTHPMWGTEFSGPEAAQRNVLQGKNCILCKENTDEDVIKKIECMVAALGMNIIYMNGMNHDVHLAYVSHISHITSFALANTVLEKEKEEDNIFDLASSGFESTVRLAKSNPDTWVPIFMQNKENVLDVLNEHISQLRKFKSCLEKENWNYLKELIDNSNKIRKILGR